jgi:uncharacterized membrane protein YtjA (UPF0391 family)
MSLVKWAAILFIIAIVLAVLGFGGMAEGVADVAQFLLALFIAGIVLLVILGIFAFRSVT